MKCKDQEKIIDKYGKACAFWVQHQGVLGVVVGGWVGASNTEWRDCAFELLRVLVFTFNLKVFFPLSQVLAALGIEYFENILPEIIRNCSHQKASVRDGHLALFRVSTCLF